MPIPTSLSASSGTRPTAWPPNSNPKDADAQWCNAVIVYVAKEFTGGFVNHCHILGHQDRGMMHNTQVTCSSGQWAKPGPILPGATCEAAGFCLGGHADRSARGSGTGASATYASIGRRRPGGLARGSSLQRASRARGDGASRSVRRGQAPVGLARSSAGRSGVVKRRSAFWDTAAVDFSIREDFPKDALVQILAAFARGEGGNLITITVADQATFEGAAQDPEKYDLLRARMGGWTEFVIAMFPGHQSQHQLRPGSTPGPEPAR